tara:strand:- start:175 stop:1584 length:1410 start_codon:yes stop_codon:yes gene_type:complete
MAVFQNNLLAGAGAQSSGGTTYSIDQSIKFNDDDSAYMSRTLSASNRKTFTISLWAKRSNLNSNMNMFGPQTNNTGSGTYGVLRFPAGDTLEFFDYTNGTTNWYYSTSTRVFRDPSAWYHIVASFDTTNAISSERIKVYINGQRETGWSGNSFPTLNYEGQWNNNLSHEIGAIQRGSTNQYFDGYLSEIVFLDGTATDCNSFAEFNDSGIWIPKDVSGLTFGTNGFYIDGRDSSDLGDDESGNGNDFTTSGLSSDDQVADSPTNNYGVFNVLEKDLRYSTTISNGNKTITFPSGSTGFSGTRLGLFRSNGKAYAEFKVNQAFSFSSGDGVAVFVCDDTQDPVSAGGGSSAKLEAAYTGVDGIIYDGASNQGTGTTWNTVNAVVGIYIDFDNGKGWFSKDGTVQTVNGTPNVETGANPHFTFTANSTLTVGAGGVHYATPAIVTLQNYAGEWATTPTSYTAFSTKAEGEA